MSQLYFLEQYKGITQFETPETSEKCPDSYHDGETWWETWVEYAQGFLWRCDLGEEEKKIRCLVVNWDQARRFQRGDRTWGRVWGDTGRFSAESWRSCSHTGPSSRPATPASPSAGTGQRRCFTAHMCHENQQKMAEGRLCGRLAWTECDLGPPGRGGNGPIGARLLLPGRPLALTRVSRLKAVFLRSCNARCMNSKAWQSTQGRPAGQTQTHTTITSSSLWTLTFVFLKNNWFLFQKMPLVY